MKGGDLLWDLNSYKDLKSKKRLWGDNEGKTDIKADSKNYRKE
jgi:hypothetical protein